MPVKIKPYLCKHCGETDPAKFYVAKNGKYSRVNKSNCKNCHNSNRNKYNKDKRKKIIESKGGKCEICGYDMKTGSYQALVFHHIDPKNKDPNWQTSRGWSEERLIKEVEGCMLLCANCHAEEHDVDFFRT